MYVTIKFCYFNILMNGNGVEATRSEGWIFCIQEKDDKDISGDNINNVFYN
jgi:hypothetical protein